MAKQPWKTSVGVNVDDKFVSIHADINPSAVGYAAPKSSLLHDNANGYLWLKVGPANTDWVLLNDLFKKDALVQNLDIDDGQTEIVDEFPDSACDSCEWDYVVIKDGNRRAGTIKAVWVPGSLAATDTQFYEDSTPDIGDTQPCVLYAAKNGSNISLYCHINVGGGDNWSVKAIRQRIM